MGFTELMQLPLKRFWFIVNQIDRLRADDDLRFLQITASAGSSEAFEAAYGQLREEMGKIYVWEETASTEIRIDPVTGLDPEFDRAALRSLKGQGKVTG